MRDYDVQVEKGSGEVVQNYKVATSEPAVGIQANYNFAQIVY